MALRENKNTYQAQFNMGALDFDRIHEILKMADELGVRCKMYDYRSLFVLRPYYAVLHEFYINIQPLVNETERNKIRALFTRADREIENTMQSIQTKKASILPHKILTQIHEELLNCKQYSGMGIPVRAKRTETQTLKGVLKLGRLVESE